MIAFIQQFSDEPLWLKLILVFYVLCLIGFIVSYTLAVYLRIREWFKN
jgi:hypothetical protein